MRIFGLTVALALVSCFCSVTATVGFLDKIKKKGKPTTTVHVIYDGDSVESPRPKPIYVDRCGRHEVWYSCLPSCSITCSNLYRDCRTSTQKCEQGCDCARGYARLTSGGPCVSIKKCPRESSEETEEYQCGRNEVFSDCGSPCNEKCNDDKLRVCAAVCRKGCFCKPGFVRKHGKCVNNDICLKESSEEEEECDINEEYKKCGWRSDEKCDSRSRSGDCKSGCYCKKGYARINDKCERRSKCEDDDDTGSCLDNEVWSKCGYKCQDDCDDRNCGREERCKPRCLCKTGFKRINGRCVDIRECRGTGPDRTCDNRPNEVYKSSGLRCDEDCKRTSCGRRESGCFCQEGYSRIKGVCKPTSECKKLECGAHQSYRCYSQCQERCGGDSLICGGCSDGCYCKDNYTRESPLFDCIPRDTCSSENLPDVPIF